ncbi:MurR/RpiR family transcriptional regulator [Xylocopilactobacillus apicola]|uniref:Transcriptional regulator n=1 Tax=Xylocopilactobacillus apicola TaxID=2932184 RepID=A0AAU9DHJ0_9LACO|nr:MurR/RpiR family transcriptional regulator [Xylocopilactobacillus apicola]BDR57766.1 transcriptional regulator [Xylocopilactobacillus apicola]
MTLLETIQARLRRLSPVNRALAQQVLNDPDSFLNQTTSQIAHASGVSDASVIRFVRLFGFADLRSFKLTLAREEDQFIPDTPLDPLVQDEDDLSTMMHKLSQTTTEAVNDLLNELDQAALKEAIKILRHANRIYLAGVSASALAAQDLYQKLIRAGKLAIFDRDTHTALERAYYMTADDVLIAFSYGGFTKEVVLMAQQARKNGAPVIVVTRKSSNPLRETASCVITLPPTESLLRIGAITSLFGETYVANILFLGTVQGSLNKMEQNYRATTQLTNKLKLKGNKDK